MQRHVLSVVVMVGMLAAAAVPARAEASLAGARELYAAAAYDEALAMLETLLSDAAEDREVAGLYRILCLVALGRSGDVGFAIDALVSDHPMYRPAGEDLPPRLWTAFTDARQRLLPSIIQQRYVEAKAAYDRGDFAVAAPAFAWVIGALEDPDVALAAAQSPLADLRTLASGFQDLSENALAPPPPLSVLPPPPSAVEPAAPVRDYRRVYRATDAGVVPPVAIRQALPRYPGRLTTAGAGVLELVIDATGAVESARMLSPIQPMYDELAVSAAKKWLYHPARVDEVPVRFLKHVQVTLAPGR